MKAISRGNPDIEPLHLQALTVAENLVIVSASAEPVVEYGKIFAEVFSPRMVIPVGYVDHVFGYLPTTAMLEEGGYEANQSTCAMNFPDRVAPGVEGSLTEHLRTLRGS